MINLEFYNGLIVRVQQEVRIEENCIVNGSADYNVFFYIGERCDKKDHDSSSKYDYNSDDEDDIDHEFDDSCNDDDHSSEENNGNNCKDGYFHVHPYGVTFNASVMVPNGQIQVYQNASSSSPGLMNGLFIAEKFH